VALTKVMKDFTQRRYLEIKCARQRWRHLTVFGKH